jgi:signal transduction histidine kinase
VKIADNPRTKPWQYLIGPPGFVEPEAERQFKRAYQDEGITLCVMALYCGAITFVLMALMLALINDPTADINYARLSLAAIMAAAGSAAMRYRESILEKYELFMLAVVFLAEMPLVGFALFYAITGKMNSDTLMPTVMFALWLHYGLARFSIRIMALTGLVLSVVCFYATVASALAVQTPLHPRYALFLIAMNIVGLAVANMGEIRERRGFFERLNKERALDRERRLVKWLTHELRQPLSAAQVSTENLRLLLSTGRTKEAINVAGTVEVSIHRIDSMLTSLFEASRSDRLTPSAPIQRVDARAVAIAARAEVLSHLERGLAQASHWRTPDVRLYFDAANPLVDSNAEHLHQIISNLLSNAIRHGGTKPGNIVVVSGRAHSGVYTLTVTDQGPGIEPEDQTRIYEPYVRLSSGSDATGSGGMGLGLSIVRTLVAGLRGHEVKLHSERGKGASFSVTIPLTAGHALDPVPLQPTNKLHHAANDR